MPHIESEYSIKTYDKSSRNELLPYLEPISKTNHKEYQTAAVEDPFEDVYKPHRSHHVETEIKVH